MKRIAVFASGNGSNFQVIAEQFEVAFVFSDRRNSYVLERAKKLGVPAFAFELKEFSDKQTYEEAIIQLLDQHQIDLVVLAGYMKIVGPTLLAQYEGRIINIHPAYLPEFPGAHGIEDAWNAGVAESGVTVHWVDSGIDTGQIIKQVRVPRLADDTLEAFEARIHEAEYQLYPAVLEELGANRKRDFCVQQLKSSPLFAISLGGKEISHSNFWAWLIDLKVDGINPFVEVFIPSFYSSGYIYESCTREEDHRDLSIYYQQKGQGKCHIVENKLKSLPIGDQLLKYEQNFKKKNYEFSSGTITGLTKVLELQSWQFLSYKVISERIINILEHTKGISSINRELIMLYANDISCLSDLLLEEIESTKDRYVWKGSRYLEELKFDDVFLKYVSNEIAREIEREVMIPAFQSEWGLPKVAISFHNKKATIDIKYHQQFDDQEVGFIGIQIEGKQFRLHSGARIGESSLGNKDNLFNKLLELGYLENYSNKEIRGRESSLTKQYGKYGHDIYQYWNIGDMSRKELIICIKEELPKVINTITKGLDFIKEKS